MAQYKGTNADGQRMKALEKEREKAAEEFKTRRDAMEDESKKAVVAPITERFVVKNAREEEEFVRQTTGLVTVDQFRNKKRQLVDKIADAAERARQQRLEEEEKQRKKPKRQTAALSFDTEEDGQPAPAPATAAKKAMKNPAVDTTFLPDRDRELKETELRDKLAKEWMAEQERIKATPIQITYSFWDGSGHRRALTVTKGTTVAQFLDRVRAEFKELRSTTVDQLLLIKEDLIIPHTYSFYDLIESKARGKSGPLFHFDVHDDVRLVSDAAVEKDESHAAKVVERHWYEQNKHIFPASRWEIFDPLVQRGGYTIHDQSKSE